MPSSVIRAYSFNETSNILEVEFVSGIVYEYLNVPLATFQAMKADKRKGIFFNQHIKDKFQFRRKSDNSDMFKQE